MKFGTAALLAVTNIAVGLAFVSIDGVVRTTRLKTLSSVKLVSEEEDFDINPPDNTRRQVFGAAVGMAIGLDMVGTSPASAATLILEDSEARRIDLFERSAPSVVFIDTFVEKQDAFSPNVMEVPLGSGSGFVWDKEGHIGKEFLLSSPWSYRSDGAESHWQWCFDVG